MCNLSEGIRNERIAEGIIVDITKGKAEEELNLTIQHVMKLMQYNNSKIKRIYSCSIQKSILSYSLTTSTI